MNTRRDFFKQTALITGGLVIGRSTDALAFHLNFPEGVIYTKDKPGKWSGKVEGHLPVVKVKGKKVTITTKHSMSERHYIVRHTLVSVDGKVIGEKVFYPSDPNAESTFEVPANSGHNYYATSFCNLHDLWLVEFRVF